MRTINTRVLKSRIALSGYNQKTLSDKMGVSRGTVSSILNGTSRPSYPVMVRLCEVLNLDSRDAGDIFFNNSLRNAQVETSEGA